MKLGVIGLGRMGGNISVRLMRQGHQSTGLSDMVAQLPKPRVVWVMLPAGHITEETVQALGGMLEQGDIIIDGGNTMY